MTPEEWAGVVILAIGIGAGVFGILRWFYNRGRSDVSRETSSGNVHTDLYGKIEDVQTAVTTYTKQNEKDHKLLFAKIESLRKDTRTNMVSLAYIKGKIDSALKQS